MGLHCAVGPLMHVTSIWRGVNLTVPATAKTLQLVTGLQQPTEAQAESLLVPRPNHDFNTNGDKEGWW